MGFATLAACYLINRMPSSVLHDQIPHSIIFPNQHLFCLLPHFFWLSFLSIFLLPGKTSFQPKPQSVSSSVIPDFNKGIVVTLLIHIYTLSLPMSHFFINLLCSLPPLPTFGVLSLSLFFPVLDTLSTPPASPRPL